MCEAHCNRRASFLNPVSHSPKVKENVGTEEVFPPFHSTGNRLLFSLTNGMKQQKGKQKGVHLHLVIFKEACCAD